MIDKLCVQFRVFDWLSWYKDYFEDVSKHNIIEAKELCKLEEKRKEIQKPENSLFKFNLF